MTPQQVDAMVESLVAEFNGCIKYAPMLQDQSQILNGAKQPPAELAKIRADALDTAKQLHALGIGFLAQELKRPEYAGKTPEQMQSWLTTEHVVTVNGVQFRQQPPITRIWHGLPYARNLPTIDNINEARK